MKRRPDSNLASFDELLEQKSISSTILTSETNSYLESLLNLEVSALKKDSFDENKLKALSELKFYRELVFYNLYMKSKQLVDNNSVDYRFADYYRGLTIYYGSLVKSVTLMNLGQNDNISSLLQLFDIHTPDFEGFKLLNDKKIRELYKKYNEEMAYYKKDNLSAKRIMDQIKKLEALTDDELKVLHEQELAKAAQQRSYLSLALQDMGLDMNNDFTEDKSGDLVRETGCSKIIIRRKIK